MLFKQTFHVQVFIVSQAFAAPMPENLAERSSLPLDLTLSKLVPQSSSIQPLSISYPVPTYMGPQASIPYISGVSLDGTLKKVSLDSIKTPFPAYSFNLPSINNYANTPYLYLG